MHLLIYILLRVTKVIPLDRIPTNNLPKVIIVTYTCFRTNS